MTTYFNLPHELDLLINRIKVKSTADGYTDVVVQANKLHPTLWYSLLTQINNITFLLSLYQVHAVDGDLQDYIDKLTHVSWYNFLTKVKTIEKAVTLIETL